MKKKKGVATVIALVALAVVGSFVAMAACRIIAERDISSKSLRKTQADRIALDMAAISKAGQNEFSFIITKSQLKNRFDLKVSTTKISDGKYSATAEYVAEKIPAKDEYVSTVQTQ